jgi:NOL1/NOP2/sun family putative RNA methylase
MIRKLAKKYGYKQESVKRYMDLFGEDIEAFLKANEAEPRTYLRVNTLKISSNKLKRRLQKKEVSLQDVEGALLVKESPFSLSSTPEYLLGYFYIQGIAEMQIAPLLNPGESVIDMCAAPGGKTTHLAQIMGNKGFIIALDVNKNKIKALKANINRLGVTNTIVYSMSALHFTYKSERILLDAPCTGSGIIRKDPTRKYSRDSADIDFCSRLQKDLLKKGIENLKDNGILVYSTCSLEPEENEMVIDWALKNLPVEIEPIDFSVNYTPAVKGFRKPFGTNLHKDVVYCRRTLPHVHNCNGMFVAKLRRKGL